MRLILYTENDSKVGFWLRWLCSTFFVFTRALCLHNGRSFQTKNLRSRLAKFPTFESFSVYFLVSLFCFHQVSAVQAPISGIYLGSREGDPASIIENVSTIHGDYTEVEVDLTVASPDSLVLSRFYSSRDTLPIASFGGWRFNPHCFLTVEKDPKGKMYSSTEGKFERAFVYVGNPDGSILTYVGWKNVTNPSKRVLFKIDAEEESIGIANTARGEIGAWTNLKNNELYYNPENDSFELLLGTEGKRSYTKNPTGDFYRITHEILPSGNKVLYEFDDNKLAFIKETNAAEEKTLAWIKIQYGDTIHLETSDGKTVDYQFEKDPSGFQLLKTVVRSDKPDVHYQYKVADDHAFLIKKTMPEGRFVSVDYYPDKANQHKVRSVTTPTDSGRTLTTQFNYDQDSTEINGPGDRKAVYRFDEDLQLIAIEQYLDGSLYRIHQKSWGRESDAGNLCSTSVSDEKGNVFYHKCYIYDSANKGNIVEEREYGDIAGIGAVPLMVDENGLVSNQDGHIKYFSYFSGTSTQWVFQKDAKGTGIKCWYKKGTNLLLKKFVLTRGSLDSEDENENSGIKQRFFYTYNDDAALIRVISDDGGGVHHKDFFGVQERMLTSIFPKQEMPNVGAPETIEQKYCSSDGKLEFLIKRTVNHFDDRGNIDAQDVYDADGKHRYTIKKKYLHGLLVFETDPIGNETHYSYDANHNLKLETHSNTGISVEYDYDPGNRLIQTVKRDRMGNQLETRITYDKAGYKCKERDGFGNEIIYENDSLGRLASITYPDTSDGLHTFIKPTYIYTYDLFNNPVSVTDPKGRVLTRANNVKGQPAKINYLDGTGESFQYDSGGNLHHHRSRNGILEIFEYDYVGHPSKIKYFSKDSSSNHSFKSISCEYSAFHKTSEYDAEDTKTTYTYDGSGRLIRLKKENQKVEFSYDFLGRMQSIKRWKSSKDFTLEVKEHDLLDRIIEERTQDSSGNILTRKKFIYNDAGELAKIIGYPQNKESILLEYDYDGFGRLFKVKDAAGNITQVIYEDGYVNDWGQRGSRRIIIDPSGNRTEEMFDNDHHLIQVMKKDKSGNLLSCVDTPHDIDGNKLLEKATVVSVDGSSGNYEIEYSYKGDQLESVTTGKGAPEERVTRFKYNSYGELANRLSPGAQSPITYKYDNYGDLESVSYTDGKKEVEFRLSYDRNKNLTSIKNRDTVSVGYDYDKNDLPTTETVKDEFGSYQVTRIYDGEGKVQILKFPDGSYVEYAYEGPFVKKAVRFSKDKKELYSSAVAARDQMGNILEEILPGHLGARTQVWDETGRRVLIATDFFQDKVLEYDPSDNITKRETSLDGERLTAEYDYNALLQLTSEKGKIEHHYTYDSIDNRLKKDGSIYKVNSLNEISEADGRTYTFHPNGTIATKTGNGNTWTYQSNPMNQIVSIKDSDQNTVAFTYGLTGKRFTKRIDFKNRKSRILRFFYIDDTEIGCMDENGAIVELKIPGNPNNPEEPAIAIELKKETYVPIYDLQGNIVCMLDSMRRKIVESYHYSVYGEEQITNGKGKPVSDSSIGNPWRYRAKRTDKEVGLIFFGYRYYDPGTGRWISPDPAGTIDGPNLYAFVRNNPIKYVDYFGFNSVAENCGCVLHGHPGWHNAPPDCVCICGRNGVGEIVGGGYRSTRGSDIKSALGGISHGVVDFVAGSLHDLQTAAVYVGSAELEMALHERIQMIEAVEQSQMQQKTAVGSHVMGMLGVDASDAVYHSFRSKTTLGLEIGSLVVGGYGAVKGVIGFTKLARMPTQIAKTAKAISRIPSNPLEGAKYTRKVLLQMENNLKTGKPDFHGFPRIVDNYAGLGKTELIKGKDGLTRVKISLEGSYKGQDGCFEWILESDRSINHRIFIPIF